MSSFEDKETRTNITSLSKTLCFKFSNLLQRKLCNALNVFKVLHQTTMLYGDFQLLFIVIIATC